MHLPLTCRGGDINIIIIRGGDIIDISVFIGIYVKTPRTFFNNNLYLSRSRYNIVCILFPLRSTSCLAKKTLYGWNGILLKKALTKNLLVDLADKSIYIYMNQRTLRRAANEFRVLSDLSEDEIADLEDEVISHRSRSRLGPSSFFVYLCKCGSYLAETVSKRSCAAER